jgi:alanyl-tRNA synthetase
MTGDGTKKMTGNEIREMFLRFFESKKGADGQGHRRVRSSSLVPHGDATLLFTNAGMNQFKDVFLGLEKREYNRATTAQKCVRAGGKHNDLENVGFTKRHHTFFEMMGNFSFGDYFKKDAIAYAWELITSPEWFNISKDKLYVTVFGGAEVAPGNVLGVDEEAREFWVAQNVAADRVVPIPGLKDNFWAMGDTGPCGPCSEIFYDMGPAASEEGHPDCKFPCDCGRYVEIWNLVFMQFNRDASGTLTPLPKPCVDTGMGLERVAAVLQGVISNYDTDLFVPLLKRAAELCDVDYEKEISSEAGKGGAASLRVVADHARATTFLITDGVLPSNEGRGYVLRKIIRRAVRHGRLLGHEKPFLSQMVSSVTNLMGVAYPELLESAGKVLKVVEGEEKNFARTLSIALSKLDELVRIAVRGYDATPNKAFNITEPTSDAEAAYIRDRAHTLDGEQAFTLYDTFGLPIDFIQDAARDAGVKFDQVGFDAAMDEQKTRARASWKGGAKEAANPAYAKLAETFKTEPDFYFGTNAKDCRIEAIFRSAGVSPAAVAGEKEPAGSRRYESVNELKPGESGEIVLDRTAIYAESGGQVADTGAFYGNSESQLLADVKGAFYPVAGLVAHKVLAKETLRVGDRVTVVADAERRARIIRNHTGTHLVNAALRNILGTHVKQSGSLNAPERLRFDFSHFAHVDAEELRDIEQQVNDEIRLNTQIETNVTSLEDALASGALAFFGDKYPEHNVRVVTIPDPRAARGFYSKELCGGTHVQHTGDIGVLKIVSEESVAAGVRRIEAVTGIGALEHYQRAMETLRGVAQLLNVGDEHILMRINELAEKTAALEKDLGAAKRLRALLQIDELDALIRESREKVSNEAQVRGNSTVQLVKGTKVAWSQVQDIDKGQLREIMDKLRQEIRSGVVVLASVQDGGVSLIAGVTKDLTAKVHAGKLMQALAPMVGGKGGGRPDLAEAGGKDTTGLKLALESVPSLVGALL